MKNIKAKRRKFNKQDLLSWLVLLPSILIFAFFIWMPLIDNVILSFFSTKGYAKQSFIGFQNYQAILSNPLFGSALKNTLMYTFWSLVIGFFIPIILAVLVSEAVHFRGFFKASLYVPNIVPGIAAVTMWKEMMDPNPYGFFNIILQKMGLGTSMWLSNPNASIPLIILTMTWKGAGATMLIYLASIQTIDPVQYEVARLEGAGFWQRIRYITIPSLMTNIKLLLIMQIISVFQVFYEPYVLTGGGPNNRTLSLTQLIYRLGFDSSNLENYAGQSAALGVIVSLFLLLFTAVYLYAGRERKEVR